MSRNIVLITLDSLRADHCSFMGYSRETTPTLDRLADRGLVFENAVASGVPTIASMTSVMTGEHSLASPDIGFSEKQRAQVTSRKTLAEALSDAGYSTGALSPNPPASSYFGFDEGFDWFEDFLHDDRGVVDRMSNRLVRQSLEGGELSTYLRLFRNVVRREEVLRPWDDYYDAILQWCERVDGPYFLWVLLLEPHHPWLPPKEHQQWSSRSDVYQSFRYYWRMLNADWKPDFTPEECQRLIDLYDDSIRHGDRFLQRLQRDLSDDDPVFVVHSDHGEEFGEHGRYGHQPYLYENLVHVPLVIANGDEQGTIQRPVELRSLAPTVAKIANVPASFSSKGLLATNKTPWTVSKVFADGARRMAIRTRHHKYVGEADRREFYDLRLDPDEQVNVADENGETASLFEQLATNHVETEREKRAIETATDTLREET